MKSVKFTLPDGTVVEYQRESRKREEHSDEIFAAVMLMIMLLFMVIAFGIMIGK